MPTAAAKLCPKHGVYHGRCPECLAARPARKPDTRPGARERGYTRRWEVERAAFLRLNRKCCRCSAEAVVVDHIVPHKGDDRLFWDRSNWQAMCSTCHNRKTATTDGGFGRGGQRNRGRSCNLQEGRGTVVGSHAFETAGNGFLK